MTAPVAPVPRPTPETEEYWQATARGELVIQRCAACGQHFFYPRSTCPRCASDDVPWVRASGRATLYSYVINHLPVPGFSEDGPYAIAVVELAEGPRMMSSIVGVPATPEELVLDMPLEVTFQQRGDYAIPVFTKASAQ
jgi:uncharacterized protein